MTLRHSVILFVLNCTLMFATFAQEYPKHNLTVGVGVGAPLFERSRSIWETSSLLSVSYGFRLTRHFQADAAYTRAFNPADKQFDPAEPVLERREVGGGALDSYFLGGRVVMPVHKRLLFGVGAGAVHERFYAPELRSGSWMETGWGVYALGSVAVQLDQRGRFSVGCSPRLEVVQSRDAWLHRNRWLRVPIEFGFRW